MKAASAKSAPVEVPAFSSDRLRLMAPFLTARTVELAQRRVFEPGFKIVRRTNAGGKEAFVYAEGTPAELKGALMLTKEINPAEHFNGEEEAMYRGADRKTIGTMKARGDISDE